MANEDPFSTQTTEYQPRQLGRYSYRRPLAAGGLGVVSIYFDTELNREVALKEIRVERADDERQRRYFCGEAEVTGILEHPGIVPIYSMGTSEEGRPYYAMRLIGGSELRDHVVDFHKAVKNGTESLIGPSLRQLLQRLIDVCDVIQYSHSRGVLHRDLKSANVMLGRYGETLVIDWGLAKATGIREQELSVNSVPESIHTESVIELSGANLRHTQDGIAMDTIAYAPPEQLNGKVRDIDARSDVYSIGAILYEILTGDPPCKEMGLTQALRAIEAGTIPPPVTVRSDVPRALNAIACKALSATKQNRYQTAELLKNDIQNWLDDQPIAAYQESRLEKLARWRRQHETFVRWATASLLAVTLISLIALYRIDLARKQQQQARSEATTLYRLARTATDQLLKRTSDRLSELPDATDVQQGLLQDAVASYQAMAEVRSNDPALKRESAKVSIGLAEVQRLLSETDNAIISLQEARTTLISLRDPEDQILLARIDIEESRLQGDKGDFKASEAAIAKALPITESLTHGNSVSNDALLARGQALIQRGVVASDFMDYVKAVESFESATDSLRRLLERELPGTLEREARLQLLRAYNNEALKRRSVSDSDTRIIDRYAAALSQAEWLNERYPTDTSVAKEYAAVLNNYGNYLLDTKDLMAAKTLYQKSTEFFAKLATNQPTVPEYKERWVLALTGLGNVAHDEGDLELASEIFETTVEISRQLLSQNRNRITFLVTAAQADVALASATMERNPEQASTLFDHALALLPKTGADELHVFIEVKKLELLNQSLRDDDPDTLLPNLASYIVSTSTLESAEAQYNAACVISRTCKSLIQNGEQNEANNVKIDKLLDAAVKRLADAIAQSPAFWDYIAKDSDLAFLSERRNKEILAIRPNP